MTRQRKWQIKNKAAGNCIFCGKKRKNYANDCDKCHKKRAPNIVIYMKKYRARKKAENK